MSATTETDQVVVIEPVTEEGLPVIYPADVWRTQLETEGLPLDGDGGLVILELPTTLPVGTPAFVFGLALPEGCQLPAKDSLEFSFQCGKHETDPAQLIISQVIADPVLNMDHVLFGVLDVGACRPGLEMLCAQKHTFLLELHPRTGEVLGRSLLFMPLLRDGLADLLARCKHARPASDEEHAAAVQRVRSDIQHSLDEPVSRKPQSPRFVEPGNKVARNEPCPCGSGLKSKRCCHA